MNIMMYGFDNNAFIDNNTMQRRMYLYSVDGFNIRNIESETVIALIYIYIDYNIH